MPANGTLAAKANQRRHLLYKNANLLAAKISSTVVNGGELLTHGSHGLLASVDKVLTGSVAAVEAGSRSVIGLAGMGLVGATSAAIAQMDYRHEIDNLINTYRDELAAKLGKPAHALAEKDLDILAKGDHKRGIEANSVIAQELYKKRSERNLGVLLSAGASLATLAIVSAVIVPLGTAAAAVGVSSLLMEGLVGVGIYNVVKMPLHKIGHKLFGLDHETTHDRIESLKRDHEDGKAISREQVLSVFASANPKLDQYIAGKYGDHFDKLSAVDQKRATQDPQITRALSQLAAAIDQNWLRAGELAFTATGQVSGYDPDHPASVSRGGRLGQTMVKLCRHIGLDSLVGPDTAATPPVPPRRDTIEYDNPPPAVSFVDQYAASRQNGRSQQPAVPPR